MSVTFLSPEWLELAQKNLVELVASHGVDGQTASLCEVFTDAPAGSIGMAQPGRAAWHFRIDGTTCTSGEGEADDTAVKFVFDYATILPMARMIMDPAQPSSEPPPFLDFKGDPTTLPPYLVELHNRLAEQTA
jgi:hypothetical protein